MPPAPDMSKKRGARSEKRGVKHCQSSVSSLLTPCSSLLLILGASCSALADNPVPHGFELNRYQHIWEKNPFTLTTPATPVAQESIFDKLVLVSWMKTDGKDTVYVRHTDTNAVDKVTAESGPTNLRLIEVHPNANPRLFEAVISDGTQQKPLKFSFEAASTVAVSNPPVAPNPIQQVPQQPNVNAQNIQRILNGRTPYQPPVVNGQPQVPGQTQVPTPPTAQQTYRKRMLPQPPQNQNVQAVPQVNPNRNE
jgi:hypothetical protein